MASKGTYKLSQQEIEKRFDDVCMKKRLDSERPLKLVIWNRFEILHVGTRTRKDLDVVVSQINNKHRVGRSTYANHLWNKPLFKN